jgi:ABC-type nitrate/sulfonate/bicarbonate transport system substrate-binding protein
MLEPAMLEKLPMAEQTDVNLGYMRLSDSAPVIMAKELGLYEKYGLDVSLHREVSWANLRDKMIAGAFQACEVLAPMPLVTTLGVAGIRAPMVTGLVLSLNGNGITLAAPLWQALVSYRASLPEAASTLPGYHQTAMALKAFLSQNPKRPLTLASVHHFSTHTLLLHRWLALGGIDSDREVRIIVLPPEQMVDSLTQGVIDGYCVGEPWNTIAVANGTGELAASSMQVWPDAPEKALAVMESWHDTHASTHLRLRLALMETGQWLVDPTNRPQTIETLARSHYLDLLPEDLSPSLQSPGDCSPANFHLFEQSHLGFPWHCEARAQIEQIMPLIGKAVGSDRVQDLVKQCYRTDLYRQAAILAGVDYPFHDERTPL